MKETYLIPFFKAAVIFLTTSMESKATSDKESLTQRLRKLDHLLRKCLDDFIAKYDGYGTKIKQLPVSAWDFETKYIINRGQFGEVQIVQKMSKEVYAMRILHKDKIVAHHEDVSFLLEDLDLLVRATSPWITKLHFAFQDAKNLYLVMECHCGDLRSMLTRCEEDLEEDIVRFYTGEITLAIHNLHLMGYVHRDLKPENVLLDCRGHVMLAGFGFAVKLDQNHLTTSRMTIRSIEDLSPYTSPELLATNQRQNVTYGAEVDWWSLGVCLYEMLYRKLPFTDNVAYSILNHKKCLKFPENAREIPSAVDLTRKLLTNQDARLKYSGIEKHSFLASFKWDRARKETAPCKTPKLSSVNFKFDQDVPDMNDSLQTSHNFSGKHLPFYNRWPSPSRSQWSTDCKPTVNKSTDALKQGTAAEKRDKQKGKNESMTLPKCLDSTFCKTKVTQQQPQTERSEKDHGSGNGEYIKLAVEQSKLQQHNNHQNEECSALSSEHTLLKQKFSDLMKVSADAESANMALRMQLKDFQSAKDLEFRNLNALLKAEQERVKVLERKGMEDAENLKHTLEEKEKELNNLSVEFKIKKFELNSTIKALKIEIHNLNDDFDTKSAQEAMLMAKLQQEIQEIKGVLNGKEDKTSKLQKDAAFLRDSLTNAQRLTESLKSEIREKDQILNQLRENLKAVKESEQKIKMVVHENQDAKLRMISICANLDAISSQKKELEGEVERKETLLKELADELATLQEGKMATGDKILKLENEKQELFLNMNELKVEINDLKLENQSHKQELREVKNMLEEKDKELDSVQLELYCSRDQLAVTQSDLEPLLVQFEDISYVLKMHEERQLLLATTKAKSQEVAISHPQDKSDLTTFNPETEISQQGIEIRSIQDKIYSLLGDVDCLNKVLEETQDKYNSICHMLKESKMSCEKLASEKEEMEKCLYHQDEEKCHLLKELDHSNNYLVSLKTEKAELEQSLCQALFKVEIKSTHLMDLSKQLEEAENKCQFLNEMLDKVRTEKTEYECQIRKLERNVEDLNFRLEESKVNQEKQQHDYSKIQADFQKYKDEVNVKFVEETQIKAILSQEVEELKIKIHRKDENNQHLNKEMTQTKDALVKTQSSLDEMKSKLEENEMTLKHVHCESEATKIDLETQIFQQEKINKSLQDKINCFIGDMEHQNKLLKEAQEKYNRLSLKLKESEESCVKLATEKEKLEMCLRQENEEKHNLLKRLDHSNNDIISLQTVKAKLDQSLSQTLFKLETASTDLMDLSKQLEESESKCQFLNEMLDKVRTEKTEYECQIRKLERNVEDLNFRLEESKVNQEKQQHDYSKIQADFQKYKDEVNMKLVEETQIKAILSQEVEELKIIIHRKDENNQHLNKEMTQTKDALVKTQSSLDEMKSKLEENEMTLKHVHCESEATKIDLETQIFQQEKINKSLQDKINCFIGDMEHQNKLLKEAQEKYNRLSLKLKESEESCVKLATEKEKLEMCLRQENEEKHNLLKRLDHSNNDIISLQTVKAKLDQSLSQTLFKLETASTDLMDLSKQLEESESKCQFLNEMLDKVRTEKTEYECQIRKLERNVEDLNFRLEESKVNQEKQQHDYSKIQADFQKYKDEANVKSMEETQAKDILNLELEQLKNVLKGKDEMFVKMNNEITNCKVDVEVNNAMLERLRGEFQQYKRRYAARKLELNQFVMQKNEIKFLQENCNHLSSEPESLNHLKKDLPGKNGELNVKLKHIISAQEQPTANTELKLLATPTWLQSFMPFQKGRSAVQQTLSSSSPVTMDKKMDPQPKDHKAIDFRKFDSGFEAKDISYRMGASFFNAWFKK